MESPRIAPIVATYDLAMTSLSMGALSSHRKCRLYEGYKYIDREDVESIISSTSHLNLPTSHLQANNYRPSRHQPITITMKFSVSALALGLASLTSAISGKQPRSQCRPWH